MASKATLLVLAVFFIMLFVPYCMMVLLFPLPVPPPTIAPTVTTIPQVITPTVTSEPTCWLWIFTGRVMSPFAVPCTPTPTSTSQVVATVEVPTPNVPDLVTPTQPAKMPTPNYTHTPVSIIWTPTISPSGKTPVVVDNCRQGVITAHAAIDQVLATKPKRACDGCVYYASVMCQDIGKRLTLHVADMTIPVTVVDCATWAIGDWPRKEGADWLGELDIRSWPQGSLMTPLEAMLCE